MSLLINFGVNVFVYANHPEDACESALNNRERFRYPTTGKVSFEGFPKFLAENLGKSRQNLRLFSLELKEKFGVENISLVNSGSSANLVAAFAAKELTGPGHAVISGFTFPTTIASLIVAGYEVSLADVSSDGFNLDPDAFLRAIRPNTKVVAVTHFLGFPAAIDEITQIAKQHNIVVIQDACESMKLRINGESADARGDFTTWSFYHPHHLTTYGGGAIITNSPNHHQLAESISHWGRACTCQVDPKRCKAPQGMNHNFWYERLGFNVEMSELNASFGRWQLKSYDEQDLERIKRYQLLYKTLESVNGIQVYPMPDIGGSPFVFPITLISKNLAHVEASLAAEGVEIRSLMGGSISDHPAYSHLENDGLNNTRIIGSRSFFVGIHQTLPFEDVEKVGHILKRVLEESE